MRARQSIFIAATLLLALFIFAPTNERSSAQATEVVAENIQTAAAACATAENNTACFGSGAVSVEVRKGAGAFAAPGDVVPLDSVQTIRTDGSDWGISVARLPLESGDALNMVLMGDVQVTNLFDPANKAPECTLTNQNAGALNIHARPDVLQTVLRTLESQEKITVNGQDASGQWLRALVGTELGWIPYQNAAIDCELATLRVADPDDISILYESSLQNIQLATGADTGDEGVNGVLLQTSVNDQALLLVNGVKITVSGAAFLQVEGGAVTVTALQGKTTVEGVLLRQGDAASATSGVPPTPTSAVDLSNLPDVLNSLIFGQRYAGAGSTVPGLVTNAAVGDEYTRVDLGFVGDSATCATSGAAPVDVVFALDFSNTMSPAELSVVRAAVAAAIPNITGSPSNRYGVIGFREQAQTISDLTEALEVSGFVNAFDAVSADINDEDFGTFSMYGSGLAAARSLYKNAAPGKGAQYIVLITDGTSEADAAIPVATEIHNQNIGLITIAVGDAADGELLATLAGDAGNALAAESITDLPEVLNALSLRLSRSPAVSDLTLTYTSSAPLIGDMNLAGTLVDTNTVELHRDMVWDSEILEFPIITQAGSDFSGEVSVSYTCPDGSSPVSFTASVAAASIETPAGLLFQGALSQGYLKTFGKQLWAVDTGDSATLSVITGGPEDAPQVFLLGTESVYSLDNFENSGKNVQVFSVAEPGVHWLYVQSSSPASAGSYSIEIETGAVGGDLPTLVLDGDGINDSQENSEGRVYDLVPELGQTLAAGDLVTLRYVGDDEQFPVDVVSLDGQRAVEIYSRFDERGEQWESLQMVQGAPPYRVVVKTDGRYGIEVSAGDDLTDNRGSVNLNDYLDQTVASNNPVIVSYTINIPAPGGYGILLGGAVDEPVLHDANNLRVEALERIDVNTFHVGRYDLEAGTYTLYMQITDNYNISVIELEGGIVEALGTLKGSVLLDRPLQDTISDTPLAIYNLSAGTGKQLTEGELLTIFMGNVEASARDTVFVQSADGLTSDLSSDFSQPRTATYISVHRLRGEAPYRVIVNGLDEYRVNITRGDGLSNDKGNLIVGTSLSDSSNSPQLLTYTLSPELGKQLVEGDIVTLTFLNRGNEDDPFEPPLVTDGKESAVAAMQTFEVERLFLGVYELQGQPPYQVFVPNIGAYTISLSIGNTLELDQGEITVAEEETDGSTDGPQIVKYTLEGTAGETFTAVVLDTTRNGTSGEFINLQVTDELDERIVPEIGFFVGQALLQVYTLPADGTYTLAFTINGTYALDLLEGDRLTIDKGIFYLGDKEVVDLEEERRRRGDDDEYGKVEVYTLNIEEPQKLSIRITNISWFLYDPIGNEVFPETFLHSYDRGRFTGTQNVFNLTKPGTYTLQLFATNDYAIEVVPGDEITVDKGNAYFGILEHDKLEDNKRYATYTVNAQEGDTISVSLYIDRVARSRDLMDVSTLILTDANGDPISTTWQIQDLGYNHFVYKLRGPAPYTLTVQPQRAGAFTSARNVQLEYDLVVSRGDTARIPQGTIQVGDKFEGEIKEEAGTRTLVYDLNSSAAAEITINLTPDNNRYMFDLRLYDPNGVRVLPEVLWIVQNRTGRYSFILPLAGMYRLEFEMLGAYELELINGDIQTAKLGRLTFNPDEPARVFETDAQGNQREIPYEPITVTNSLSDDQVVALYTFDKPQSRVITLLVTGRLESDIFLEDAAGNPVTLLDTSAQRNTTVNVYILDNSEGPYTLRFAPGRSPHTVQLDEGNSLIQHFGALSLNPQNPPATVIDEEGNEQDYEPTILDVDLADPAVVAHYQITGSAGDVVTLEIADRRDSVTPLVLDSSGAEVSADEWVSYDGSMVRVYTLTDALPYDVLFIPASANMTIALYEGNWLLEDAGRVPLGLLEEPFTYQLTGPLARIAQHPLDLQPGQFLTVMVDTRNNPQTISVLDANDTFLIPEIRYIQSNTSYVEVFLLSGTPPYRLQLVVVDEYELTVEPSNLVRVDRGFILYEEQVEFELPDPGLVATYAVDGKPDQITSVALQDNNRPILSQFRDANGKLWEPLYVFVQDNTLYSVYQLGGPPPYEIIFAAEGTYNLSVYDRDVLRADKGDVTFAAEISDELEAPARTAVYNIPSQSGEVISVQLAVGNRAFLPELTTADGVEILADKVVVKRNAAFAIYTMAGEAPYTLAFDAERPYELTVTQGNVLRTEITDYAMNERIQTQLEFPAEEAVYVIPREAGQIVSVAVQDRNRPVEGVLRDGAGNRLEPVAEITKSNTAFSVYQLEGEPPYRFEFVTEGRYSITISDGNVLRADKGIIRFGNTIQDQLEEPQEAAIYIIDSVPGTVISLVLQDGGRALEGELHDADGNVLLPWGKAVVNNRAYATYTLEGTPPYRFVFFPDRRYTLTLEEGNVFRVEKGTIPFRTDVRDRLVAPARIASYTINTVTDQVISITLADSGREFVIPRLYNSSGEEIIPFAEVYEGTNVYKGVYLLRGDAPFTVEFETTNTYTFGLQRGNITELFMEDMGPEADIFREDLITSGPVEEQ